MRVISLISSKEDAVQWAKLIFCPATDQATTKQEIEATLELMPPALSLLTVHLSGQE